MDTRRPRMEPPEPSPWNELGWKQGSPPSPDPAALLAIVDDLSDGVFTLDAGGNVTSWSAGAERITGYPAAEVRGQPIGVLRGPEGRGLEHAEQLLGDSAGKEALRWQECRIQARDGRTVQLLCSLRLVRDRTGGVAGAVGSLSDLTAWVLGGAATVLDAPIEPEHELEGLVGRGEDMQDVFRRVRAAAAGAMPVLVHGEPGSGRTSIARALHSLSARRDRPLEVVECAGRDPAELEEQLLDPHGKVVASDGGTLLLEDVQELGPRLQVRLVELAQRGCLCRPDEQPREHPVDARLIATAGPDLEQRVSLGAFLPELRDALRGLEIAVPPLRERRIDVPLIVRRLVSELGPERDQHVREITREALEALVQHPWPGNVRQVRHALARALDGLRGTRLNLLALPAEVRGALAGPVGPPDSGRSWTSDERLERARLVEALERHRWNRTRTARELGISRVTLWKRIRRFGLDTGSDGD